MTIAFSPSFSLPEDDSWLATLLAQPTGLTGLNPAEQGQLYRAISALDLIKIVGFAEAARPADARTLYQIWLGRHGTAPAAYVAWFNLGVIQSKCADPAAAAASMQTALSLRPDFVEAKINLGVAQEAAGDPALALASWRSALPTPAQRIVLHNQIGRLSELQGNLGVAAEELRASLLLDPNQPDVQQHLVHLRQRMASWPPAELAVPGLDPAVAALNSGPLAALAMFDDPQQQAAISAQWIARKLPSVSERLAPADGYRHNRIRLGYLSSDFCRHAMSFLIAELLERHDRSRFEVFGYCASPDDGSDIRARVIAALDHHIPVGALSDADLARRIRADEIDILIDLNGLTKGSRIGALRWRPAPVQVTYLGYIGPIPLPELDWLICDAVTIPIAFDSQYAPRPLRVEGCYQANDSRLPVLPKVAREQEGLPEKAVVFCCVSHHYKITEAMFTAWCRIVTAVPGSVLWLINDNPESQAALTRRWCDSGLASERLIFAARVDPDRYRARLALADLFLDTMPYNAGTIASDALRMGLPLLTLQGKAFSARMASSLLTAIGLPELIATSTEDYIGKAIQLGLEPGRLAGVKAKLAGDAWMATLGDSQSFARRFEAALTSVLVTP